MRPSFWLVMPLLPVVTTVPVVLGVVERPRPSVIVLVIVVSVRVMVWVMTRAEVVAGEWSRRGMPPPVIRAAAVLDGNGKTRPIA